MRLGDREFTSEEAADLCGVTRVTVADWIARGKLGVRWTTGGHRRIPRASLAEFMTRQHYEVPRVVASPRALVAVIDDEAVWRERLRTTLEATGDFDVDALRPRLDALLAIGARCPDAVVIDTRMPGFDTPQLIESIRGETSLCRTIVVAVAMYDEEVASAKRFGADAALPKSRVEELVPVLVRMLSERQRRTLIQPNDGSAAPASGPRRRQVPRATETA